MKKKIYTKKKKMTSDSEIKIILLGEAGVGKTNLITVASGGAFNYGTMSSSSGSYQEGSYKSSNGKTYYYHLWDTAGQEAYRSLNKIFIQNSKVIICVYAIDNEHSFKELDFWISMVKEELGDKGYVIGIAANKNDLYEDQVVKDEDGKNYAKNKGFKFKATSALSDPAGFKSFLEELLVDYIKTIDPTFKDDFSKKSGFTLQAKSAGKK